MNAADKIKAILEGKGLKAIKGEVGNYLVTPEQKEQIDNLKARLIPMKKYCNVIPMKILEGHVFDEVPNDKGLIDLNTMEDELVDTPEFTLEKWNLLDFGDLTAVKNSMIIDEEFNMIDFIGNKFAKKAVRTENEKIAELLQQATVKNGTGYKDIDTVLSKDLDPLLVDSSIIITNREGYNYLDNAVDDNGNKLLVSSVVKDGVKLYKGKQQVEVMPNTLLPTSETNEIPFFVGSVFDYIRFFDRNEYQLDVSESTGFAIDSTYIRLFERFDIRVGDSNAIRFVKLIPTI